MRKKLRQSLALTNKLFLLLFFLLSSAVAFSQTVSGTITDEDQKPLTDATVQVKGTNRFALTDNAGKFTINATGTDVLIFTSVGFINQEIPVSGRRSISVKMAAGQRNLDEVVVTALGIKRESKRLGYSSTTAKVDEMQKSRTNNLMTSLEGKIAGLDISPPSAGPASSNKIRIRGQSAFAGSDNGPLIIVNGLPMGQGAASANGGGGADAGSRDQGDNLLQFNPDDIESMTVLKGAASTALYGARAANGAIVITTKNGTRNTGIGVDISSSVVADEVLDLTNFQYEFGQGDGTINPATGKLEGTRPGVRGVTAVASGQFGWGERYDGVPTIQFDGVLRPYTPASRNRIKEFFRTGLTTTNTVAVSNGGPRGSFRASYSDMEAKGITPGNDYRRRIFSLGAEQRLGDKLTVNLNINYTNAKNNNPPQGGVQGQNYTNFLYRQSPVIPLSAYQESVVDANGAERALNGFATTVLNPYFYIDREFYKDGSDVVLGTVTARYQLFKWLYLQGRINMNYSTSLTENNNPTGGGGFGTSFNQIYTDATLQYYNGTYNISEGLNKDMNYEFIVGGNHKFGNFSLDMFFAGNRRSTLNRSVNAGSSAFVTRGIYTIGNGSQFSQSAGYTETQTNSLFGSAELGWKNLLYITGTGRRDWFSILNAAHNSYFYPSVSASFIFSELTKDKVKWLNYGKLRASWADVGALTGIGAYYGDITYSYATNKYLGRTVGSVSGTVANPTISPYSLQEKEIGLELRMFGNRVNVDMAVYYKKTSNQVLSVATSLASGTGSILQNVASLENKGFEFLVDVNPVRTRNFSWNATLNTAYNISKVLDLAGQTRLTIIDWYNGGSSNEFIGKQVYEVGQPLAQIAAKTYARDAKGQILLTSAGRLYVAPGQPDVLFGSALPTFTGGWTNTFSYKKLSLLVLIDYKAGGKMISGTALNGLRQGHSMASLVGRGPGETGVVFSGMYQSGANAGQTNTTAVFGKDFYTDYRGLQIADPFIYKSDYVKLRNITLSYDFTNWVASNTKFVKGLSLSVSCRNVAILKKYVPDIDPEQVASSGDLRAGYEAVALPTTRSWGVNLNVKF
ncbi:MAG: SusC/RagA family TonB-linked outer membrane protein [Bacteroidota bacterium]